MLCAAQTSVEVLQLVSSFHPIMNHIHVASSLHRTAKWMHPRQAQLVSQHPGYATLLKVVEQQAPCFEGQATGTALWALHRLPQRPPATLVSLLAAAMLRNLPSFTNQQLSNSLLGLAKIGHNPGSELLAAAAEQLAANFEDMEGQVQSAIVQAPSPLS